MIIVPYANGAASPADIARGAAAFGGALFVVDDDDPRARGHRTALHAAGRVAAAQGGVDEVFRTLGPATADGIVTFADSTIDTTVRLAEALSLPFHSPRTAGYLRDKLRQREQLNAAGVSRVPVAALDAMTAGEPRTPPVAFPLVVKPRTGSGSENIMLAGDPEQLGTCITATGGGSGYLAERYLENGPAPRDWLGNYLSVETELGAGSIVHHGVTGRLPLEQPARETGAVFPLVLAPAATAELEDVAERAIAALGISVGFVHTEIKITPDGPQVIEVNGRLGGWLNRLMTMVGRRSPVSAAVATAAGRPVQPPGPCEGVSLIHFLQPPSTASAVGSMPDLQQIVAMPGVTSAKQTLSPGDPVDWRLGTAAMAMQVWMHASTDDELRQQFADVQALLQQYVRWT